MGISRLYSAPTPYNAGDLRELDFVQTADVMYLAHLGYPPEKMTRLDHTSWTFAPVAFGPTILPPAGGSATPTGSTGDAGYVATTYKYAITSISDTTAQESRAGTEFSCVNDLTLAGHFNSLSWTAATGADRYVVYKNETGAYGYIATVDGTSFVDRDIAANLADGPPLGKNPFDSEGNYPSTVTFNEQRLMWGRTTNKPNGIWGSQSADFENMDTSRPAKADDALSFGLVSERVNAVNQLATMKNLLALTSDAVFAINGGGTDEPLTPSNIVSRRQIGRGSARLSPIVIDNVLFFRPSQGSSVRTLGFTFEVDGFQSNNIAIFSPHLFDGFEIVAWAYQQEPYSAVWAVRDDGALLCCTWEQEQQVWGWTLCDLGGAVEDCCTITEGGVDRLYLAVRRTLNGVEDVFIERMALPLLVSVNLPYACHLDCAFSQELDEPSATIGQLFHLEGETVTAYYDGYVSTGLVVTNGTITLPTPATVVTIGLPYVGRVETLPLPLQGQSGSRHTARQMMSKVVMRVEKTRGLAAGAGGTELFEIKQRRDEELGAPISLTTGDFDINLPANWNNGSTVVVEQSYPLPATISAFFLDPVVTD